MRRSEHGDYVFFAAARRLLPAVGTAAGTVGTSVLAARSDHAHPPMSGSIIQKTSAAYNTYDAGGVSTTIPLDGTIPQNTEGTEIVSLSFTPKLSTSTLCIRYQSASVSAQVAVVALFVDSTANALAASRGSPSNLEHFVAASSTSARTYKIRIGPATAGSVVINGNLGGIGGATLSVEEIAA